MVIRRRRAGDDVVVGDPRQVDGGAENADWHRSATPPNPARATVSTTTSWPAVASALLSPSTWAAAPPVSGGYSHVNMRTRTGRTLPVGLGWQAPLDARRARLRADSPGQIALLTSPTVAVRPIGCRRYPRGTSCAVGRRSCPFSPPSRSPLGRRRPAPPAPPPSRRAPSRPAPSPPGPSRAATEARRPTAPPRGDADLVIWTDDTRQPVIEEIAEPFAEENGIIIAVQELDFGDIRDQLTLDRADRRGSRHHHRRPRLARRAGRQRRRRAARHLRRRRRVQPGGGRRRSPTTARPTACPTPSRTSPSCATPTSCPRRRRRSRR